MSTLFLSRGPWPCWSGQALFGGEGRSLPPAGHGCLAQQESGCCASRWTFTVPKDTPLKRAALSFLNNPITEKRGIWGMFIFYDLPQSKMYRLEEHLRHNWEFGTFLLIIFEIHESCCQTLSLRFQLLRIIWKPLWPVHDGSALRTLSTAVFTNSILEYGQLCVRLRPWSLKDGIVQ